MIHSLTIENFLSFKEEITFSFEAQKDKRFKDNDVVEITKGVRLSRLAIVYGANASGKSNLIKAFLFLRQFWDFTPNNKKEEITYTPFKLDSSSIKKPTRLKLIFYANEVKYVYKLELLANIVLTEILYFYPSIKPALVFKRYQEDSLAKIEFGSKIQASQIIKESLEVKCIPNISLFSAYNQVNTKIDKIDKVLEWIDTNYFQPITPKTYLKRFSEHLCSKDDSCKKTVLNYLQIADFNISDIFSEEEKVPLSTDNLAELAEIMPAPLFEKIKKSKEVIKSKLGFVHQVTTTDSDQKNYQLSDKEQSDGTIRAFGLSAVFYKLSKENPFLAIDEIESKLHPSLIEFFIRTFLSFNNKSQLLLTTHYDNLLDNEEILRKDTFWFTEKDKDGSTDLYRLTQFNDLKRISSLQKAYRFGNFGALPEIEDE